MSVTETVLIFPAGLPDGLSYRAEAVAMGARVIGASSLEFDPARPAFETWEQLPYITEAGFGEALAALVRRCGVTSIFTPHFVTWLHLSDQLASIAPEVRLLRSRNMLDAESAYRELRLRLARIDAADPFAAPAIAPKPPLREAERIGLIRLVDSIPGMCSEEKSLAVMDAARCAPTGDVVEIGSWWGKSAALFCWLARHYDIGATLCIDPWRKEAWPQGEAFVDRASAAMDPDEGLRIFEINLAPLAAGRLNYLRTGAREAAEQFKPGLEIETAAFGRTRYEGRIAMLHIDGNHALDHVAEDERLWTPHMAPGGWIIFDDYLWPFGDGPKRVGDALLEREARRIQLSFVAGTALFIQLTA